MNNQSQIQLVVLGAGGVGKSAMTVQFVQHIFVPKYDPTIEDSYRTTKDIDGKIYMVELLDTAGTEQFTAMRDVYMKNGDGFVLVYSITSKSTFEEIQDIREHICIVKDRYNFPVILCGNKVDLEDDRMITTEQGELLAEQWNCQFMETSAKQNKNVEESFVYLLREVIKDKFSNIPSQGKKRKKCIIL